MNPTVARYLRFNLVGLLGTALQLLALHVLNRAWHHHYLLASTVALELTLLHNFLWHLHYTWRGHPPASRLRALLTFHLTNGLTSLLGNLTLMPLLIHTLHTPVLVANAVAITACSVTNFLFTHKWSFALRTSQRPCTQSTQRENRQVSEGSF